VGRQVSALVISRTKHHTIRYIILAVVVVVIIIWLFVRSRGAKK
jgi:high-affinity Fe2+/Pb2+ permease